MPPTSTPAISDGAPWRSASAIVAGAVTGYHVLKIVGYSRTKGVSSGNFIKSHLFQVGDSTWFVEYHPNGSEPEAADFISLFLAIEDDEETAAVKVHVRISLISQDGKAVPSYSFTTEVVNFSEKGSWGFPKFIKREVLEKLEHLKNDSFSVRFDVTVMKDVHTEEIPVVVVPPSNIHQQCGDLLSSKEGVDVKFRVGRKIFSAHRLVLATWSPVFKVELNGSLKESTTTKVIRIKDMEAKVFEALLFFVYTDMFPEIKEQEKSVMVQHLLVAADRYNLERLKLICEDKLYKHIDTGSAASTLALAEQHNCLGLKEACFKFLSSSRTLDAVMETDGFEYLTSSCPSILKELVSNVVPR